MIEQIKEYYKREKEVIDSLDFEEIEKAVVAMVAAYEREAALYVFGNGGSAATASHFANDFNKGISEHLEKKFRMVCLCDNVATLMSIANDISYDEIFRFQLQGRLHADDLVIAISGSGNSMNVVHAVAYAKEIGAKVVGLTGFDGGKLRLLSDYTMHVPVNDMQLTEDIHMTFCHMMYHLLRKALR